MESILEKLKSLKPVIVGRYKVKGIELFGSYVRQEQSAGSDLDVLVDFREDADLIDLIGLGQFLEEELHLTVDVVPRRALRPELREAVLQEALPI